jgi:flavorubredoxin
MFQHIAGIAHASSYVPNSNLQFNQFLVLDDEPLLFHTGLKKIVLAVRDAVSTLIPPSRLRWVSFSHVEADECGALNEWLAVAPAAEPVCSFVGAVVLINDLASRPAREFVDE